jgi:hypothetical protein
MLEIFTLVLPSSIVLRVFKHPTSVTDWRYNCIENNILMRLTRVCMYRLDGITNQNEVQNVLV